MKIISWNVNGIRACAKKSFFSFVNKSKPDILCIQETKAHPDQLETNVRCLDLYQSFWSISEVSGYSGVATYSKIKPKDALDHIGIYQFDREGRVMITEFKDFTLLNIYFPNGSKDEIRHQFKQEFLKRLYVYIQELLIQKKELIVVGDYNVAYLDIDVFDPKRLSSVSGFLPEERKWFQGFLRLGLLDVYRYFYPNKEESYTWWSYRENSRKLNRGWRIDHICVSEGLKQRLKKVEIFNQETGSDHCPIAVTLS